jgi:hypothetical protein
MSKPSTIIATIKKVSANTTGINYKFGIQIPKGIKNTINLDKKKGNNLRELAFKEKSKKFTNYQTFTVFDSEERVPTGSENSIQCGV